MAKGSFLYKDLSQGALVTGTTPTVGFEYSFLNDPQPRHRVLFNNNSIFMILDLFAAVSLDCAALISTSLDSSSTARLRASASDPTVTGSLVYDSGVQSGVTDQAWNGAVIGCLPAPVTARYLRWDITQPFAPMVIGLAPCGLLWRPSRNYAFGSQEGRRDLSQRDDNPETGASFGLALPQKRMRLVTFSALTKSEVRTDLSAMDRLVGTAGDVLFVEDSDATWADRARDSIWGSFKPAGSDAFTTWQHVNVWSRSFSLSERL